MKTLFEVKTKYLTQLVYADNKRKAVKIVHSMVSTYGMGDAIGVWKLWTKCSLI